MSRWCWRSLGALIAGISPSPAGKPACASPTRSIPALEGPGPRSSPASSPACRRKARAASASASISTTHHARATVRRLPHSIALGWYAGFHDDAALSQPQRELSAGQRWRFTLRLRRPHGNLNPNGFDSELQLFELGLRATGYVRDHAAAGAAGRKPAALPVERLRQRVRDAIDAHVDDRRAAGVLAALTVGDQNAIEHDDWDLFRNTGVAHLMSISGLHVTMFAWLAGAARRGAAWRRSTTGRAGHAGADRRALGRPRRRLGLRGVLRLGRAVAAHGLDAGDGHDPAGARGALALAAGAGGVGRRRHGGRSLGT